MSPVAATLSPPSACQIYCVPLCVLPDDLARPPTTAIVGSIHHPLETQNSGVPSPPENRFYRPTLALTLVPLLCFYQKCGQTSPCVRLARFSRRRQKSASSVKCLFCLVTEQRHIRSLLQHPCGTDAPPALPQMTQKKFPDAAVRQPGAHPLSGMTAWVDSGTISIAAVEINRGREGLIGQSVYTTIQSFRSPVGTGSLPPLTHI